MTIVITGATGKLGRGIIDRLLDARPADRIVASARDPGKAGDLRKRGVEIRYGDFAQPDSLPTAFRDASQLLIVSSNAAAYGGDPLAQHRNAIAAAEKAGVRRIVYTSHMGASASSAFAPMHTHAATEAMLRQSSVAWTALRNGFYASTVQTMLGDAATTGVLSAPQDGKVCWTTHDDLAAAAAHVLTNEGKFEGPTSPLTAAQALDLDDVATLLGEVDGKPVERQVVADEEQERRMSARGMPPTAIVITLGMYRAARVGEFATVDPTLATLLGRRPTALREVLTAGRAGWLQTHAIRVRRISRKRLCQTYRPYSLACLTKRTFAARLLASQTSRSAQTTTLSAHHPGGQAPIRHRLKSREVVWQ